MSPEVQEGWVPIRLGAAVANVTQKWEPGEPAERYVGLEQIDQGSGRLLEVGESEELQSIKTRFRAGDVLFGKLRPNLRKTALVDFSGIASTDILVIRPTARVTPEFAFYRLSSDEAFEYAIKSAAGTKMPRTSWKDMADFEFPLPPLHEQRRIAEILSSVDDAIAATRAVIEQTRKVKQGVLERLLTKGIGHTRFKQTEIGEIPEGWPLTTADDVCSQISVGIVVKPSQYYVEDGIRCFRSANVREGFVEDADWVYINEDGNRVNRKSILRTGDVLVVRTGYPGTSCVVTPKYDGANCIDIIFARPDNGRIESTFLSTFINSDSGKTQVLKAEGGLAQKHFNVGAMKQMKIPLPPIAEQRQIVSKVEEFSKTEALQGEILQQHIRTKSALMSDLLTGRKRVTEALPMAAE